MLKLLRYALVPIAVLLLAGGASLLNPTIRDYTRSAVRAVVRPEPPAPITPLAMVDVAPQVPAAPSATPTAAPSATATAAPSVTPSEPAAPTPQLATAPPTATPTPLPPPTSTPPPTPTPGQVEVNGRLYDAYIPAASKEGQAYGYSCEFDAVWVIAQTYGVDVTVDDLIGVAVHDTSVEPYIEETSQGALIHGGDINSAFSGDYTSNFLARSTGRAMQPVFEHYGLTAVPVRDRAGVEAALRSGSLVWMKTTVDFKPWRPATWVLPDGSTYQTVLGNDHAVVVMGFNAESVVIRDVLGPTSSNWQRPYEYEVDWATFLAAWEAQSFDGLAVAPPAAQ